MSYRTRDGDGNDIVRQVSIKQYPAENIDFVCMCGAHYTKGIDIKKIVSSNFTDWRYVTEHVCERCADMFSLYFYSYIIDSQGVRLLNVREMAEEIQQPQAPPFKTVITTSQKKHLFYKAVFNDNPDNFFVNLEEEQIQCNLNKLREQFTFVSSLQALGDSKTRLKRGEIRHDILLKGKIGTRDYAKALKYLQEQLKSRQIQIPLYLSQKPNITEEEAVCKLDSVLNH